MMHRISGSSLAALRRWRRIVAAHPHDGGGLAAVTFRTLYPPEGGLIPLEAISAAVLRVEPSTSGPCALPFSIFGAHSIPWGASWGGDDECRFSRNLRQRPRLKARGMRFDLTRQRLLHVAMDLFQSVCNVEPHDLADRLELPALWAGFRSNSSVQGDGAEIDGCCSQMGLSRAEIMRRCRKHYQNLSLYPLDFTSHVAEHAKLFAEPETVPATQVLVCPDPDDSLTGFRGACQFSFVTGKPSQRAPTMCAVHH